MYNKNLTKTAKETVKVGATTMVGHTVVGTLGGMAPHTGTAVGTIGAGLNLINVGQLAKVGMSIVPQPTKKAAVKNNKINKGINKILYK